MSERRGSPKRYHSHAQTHFTSNDGTNIAPSTASPTDEAANTEVILKFPNRLNPEGHHRTIRRLLPDYRILMAQEEQHMDYTAADGGHFWLYHLEVRLVDENQKDSLIAHMRKKPHGDTLLLLDESADMAIENGVWYFKKYLEKYTGPDWERWRKQRFHPKADRVNPYIGAFSIPHGHTSQMRQVVVKWEPQDVTLHGPAESPRGEKNSGATDAETAVKGPTRSLTSAEASTRQSRNDRKEISFVKKMLARLHKKPLPVTEIVSHVLALASIAARNGTSLEEVAEEWETEQTAEEEEDEDEVETLLI